MYNKELGKTFVEKIKNCNQVEQKVLEKIATLAKRYNKKYYFK